MGTLESNVQQSSTIRSVHDERLASPVLWSVRANMESARIWCRVSLCISVVSCCTYAELVVMFTPTVCCSRQSQSPTWVGGFGTQPSQAQPGPVMNQANFGMAGYQTQ